MVDFSHLSFVSLVSCFVNDALCVLKRIDHWELLKMIY